MEYKNRPDELNGLFDLIRKEDVVLFLGAGVSRYAGLPSGAELSEYIFKMLPENVRANVVNDSKNLKEISSQYIYAYGKDSRKNLIRIIKSIFEDRCQQNSSRNPLSALAKAPHFKYIITTNYDSLIENSFDKDSCIVVANNNDVPKVGTSNGKTVLIKVHGDFNNIENIILTKEDYNNLYNSGRMDSPIWNMVKNLFAIKSILFLGYSYGDGNIDAIISFTNSHIKKRKEIYFISKDINSSKLNEMKSKCIIPIEMDFESFFLEYIPIFNETIIRDFNSNLTSYETASRYLQNVIPEMKNGKIIKLEPKSNEDAIEISFTTNEKSSYRKLTNIDNFDSFIIKDISNFQLRVAGITLPIDKLSCIEISQNPNDEFTSSIYFVDSGFGIRNIPTKRYYGKNKMRIVYELKGGQIFIEWRRKYKGNKNVVTYNFIPNAIGSSVPTAIEWYSLIENIRFERKFRLKTSLGSEITTSLKLPDDIKGNESFKGILDYMLLLEKIERYYDVEFFGKIYPSSRDMNIVNLMINNMEGNIIKKSKDNDISVKVTLENTDEDSARILVIQDRSKFVSIKKEQTIVNLHGKQINLGYLMFKAIDQEIISENKLDNGDIEQVFKVQKGKYKAIYQPIPPDKYSLDKD